MPLAALRSCKRFIGQPACLQYIANNRVAIVQTARISVAIPMICVQSRAMSGRLVGVKGAALIWIKRQGPLPILRAHGHERPILSEFHAWDARPLTRH